MASLDRTKSLRVACLCEDPLCEDPLGEDPLGEDSLGEDSLGEDSLCEGQIRVISKPQLKCWE